MYIFFLPTKIKTFKFCAYTYIYVCMRVYIYIHIYIYIYIHSTSILCFPLLCKIYTSSFAFLQLCSLIISSRIEPIKEIVNDRRIKIKYILLTFINRNDFSQQLKLSTLLHVVKFQSHFNTN